MATKITGAEFWAFYEDKTFWGDGVWHDDTCITVNGKEVTDYERTNIPDNAQLVIDGGVVYLNDGDEDGIAFESHLRKWRKLQKTTQIAVECPKDQLDAVKAAIKAAGGKVL